jgi:hypothetical protein
VGLERGPLSLVNNLLLAFEVCVSHIFLMVALVSIQVQ